MHTIYYIVDTHDIPDITLLLHNEEKVICFMHMCVDIQWYIQFTYSLTGITNWIVIMCHKRNLRLAAEVHIKNEINV